MSKTKVKITDMIEEEADDGLKTETVSLKPALNSSKWADFILDQLFDSELVMGSPTTDGLRRVTDLEFGEILESETEILELPNRNANAKATAKHTLVIRKYLTDSVIRVSACVDVLCDKLPSPFNQHLVSTACTRAEGKALRRALKIRVQTAEELSNSEDIEDTTGNDAMNDQQIIAIKVLCKRNNVDLVKFLKDNSEKNKTIKDIKNIEGRHIMNKLSQYQREGVPEELAGYDEGWADSKFGGKK